MDTAADSDAGATVQVRMRYCIQLFSSVIYMSAETFTNAFALGSLFVPEVKLHACFRPTTPSPFACQLLFCDIPDRRR